MAWPKFSRPHRGSARPARRALRIVTLLPFPLSHKGGVSTYVTGLLEALGRRGYEDLVLVTPDHFRGGPGETIGQLILAAQQFFQLLALQPTLVHAHEHPVLLAAAVGYRLWRGTRARVVYTVHVDPIERRRLWKRVVLGWLLGHCWRVTAVSHHTAALLGNIAVPVPSKVEVIPGATCISVRAPNDSAVAAFRKSYNIGKGPIICQIAPFNFPSKVAGVIELVHALALIRTVSPRAQLLLVGDGHLRGEIEAACERSGLREAVILTGYVSDVSLPLAITDVYCHATFHDACPLSLLEAMRSRKPVVAARVGGIPEIVSDGSDGLLIDVTREAIASAVVALLKDPGKAHSLAANAEQTAMTRFTWERAANKFISTYALTGHEAPRTA